MLPGHHRTAQRLRFLRESTEIKSVLARIQAVRFVDFQTQEQLAEKEAGIWQRISSLEAVPLVKVETQDGGPFDWLDSYVRLLTLQNTCYISFGVYSLPWIELEIIESGWVQALANEINTLDLIIMNPVSLGYIAVIEEEYFYHVFLEA